MNLNLKKIRSYLSTTQCGHTFEAANITPIKALMEGWISCKCN